MAEILEFPFDSGAYEAADRKWLPGELLCVAENVRLDRDGRLVVRPGATALSSGTMSANTLTPYDLANYQGRLVALGSQRTTGTGITDLFEWVGRASKWRATSGDAVDSNCERAPYLTNLREVGGVPDQAATVRYASLASGAGYICSLLVRDVETTVHVFDPTTNQTLLMVDVDMYKARVCFAGSDFWIYGVDSDHDIVRVNFDPLTDESLSSVTTLVSRASAANDLAVSTFGTGSAVAWCDTTSALVRTYNSAGADVANWTGVAANTTSVALAGNAAGTLISLAYQDVSNEYFISTFNAGGALQNGPTALFSGGGGSGVRLGACMASSDARVQVVGVNETTELSLIDSVQQSNHSIVASPRYYDARPQMSPIEVDGQVYRGWQDMRASDFTEPLGTFHVTGGARILPQCFLARQLCVGDSLSINYISNGCFIGTKLYLAFVQLGENTGLSGDRLRTTIVEAETSAVARRQMAEVAGELLIAGGLPLTYDGRTMVDIGFAECPIVEFTSAGTTGSLTQLATYQVKAVWKAFNGKALVARSQPSPPASYTLVGAEDSLTWSVTTPHSLRRHAAFVDQSLTVVVELYRTVGNGANFQLCQVVAIDTADDSAEPVSISDTLSDGNLADNAVVYSDESGLEIAAPGPCTYIWPSRDRAFLGGLPADTEWLMSDLNIPGRQVGFPFAASGYTQRANQVITAVGAFEGVGVVWSKDQIQQVPGRGPERSGTGEFDSMLNVPSAGGCIDWRSLVSTPEGFFFQMAPDKLMLLGRSQQGQSAGEVSFVGQPVRDTLTLFPVITGAVHIRSQMAVAFSCNASDGLSGRILIYDLRRKQWFVDNVGGPVSALAELDGRLVWLSGTTISQQDAAPGTGTFVSHAVQSGFIRVTKALGWGKVYRIGLLGAVLGACTVEAFIDYDDGTGLRSLGTETFTGSEGTFERLWSLPFHSTSRFSVRFNIAGTTGSAGLRLNGWAAEVEGSKNMVRVGSTGQVA
jgi:hypothetical protein